ncbi:MAG: response regulator transcription factor [Treponema sp.]|jgi:DNA-binding NarL/FixJ family response regulator|nr:response regulator transcription factor [Treponema sp.]
MVKIILIQSKQKKPDLILSLLKPQGDFCIAGVSEDDYSALHLAETQRPDVAVIDYNLDSLSGVELIPMIKRKCPTTMVILFSAYDDERHVFEAIRKGVSGYLLWKDRANLVNAVRIAYNGGCYVSAGIVARIFSLFLELSRWRDIIYRIVSGLPEKGDSRRIIFSPTEKQIIRLMSEGKSSKEIAELLSLNDGTVRNYISSVMRKAGTKNHVQMAIFALKNGLLDFQIEALLKLQF